jgi:ribosome biogenesis ATPase
VGESERAVRQLFQRARASAPCIIFFDELDALCPRRSEDTQSHTSERVVNQLLTEMDGLDGRRHVFVIAATNRPDMIDPAMLRPGRLDKLLYVPLPDPDERAAIVRTVVARTPLAPGVDLAAVARSDRCQGFSGADLAALVREAAVAAVRAGDSAVAANHVEAALSKVFPSVSAADARTYAHLQRTLRARRSVLPPARAAPEGGTGAPPLPVP